MNTSIGFKKNHSMLEELRWNDITRIQHTNRVDFLGNISIPLGHIYTKIVEILHISEGEIDIARFIKEFSTYLENYGYGYLGITTALSSCPLWIAEDQLSWFLRIYAPNISDEQYQAIMKEACGGYINM